MAAAENTPPLLVLRHLDCEPPGAYEDELLGRGIPLDRVLLEQLEAAEAQTVPLARELFSRWLVHVAGYPDANANNAGAS